MQGPFAHGVARLYDFLQGERQTGVPERSLPSDSGIEELGQPAAHSFREVISPGHHCYSISTFLKGTDAYKAYVYKASFP